MAPNSMQTVENLIDTASTTLNVALDPFIASFGAAGGGIFDVGCVSLSGFGVTGGGGFAGGSQSTRGGCGAKITYTYRDVPSQVPVPGSLALIALGLAAVGGFARRKV
jgi:hypothetical protein